jgi:hypothetical protein
MMHLNGLAKGAPVAHISTFLRKRLL